jgi:hypothetical protein
MIGKVRRFAAAIPAVATAVISHDGLCPACWPLVGGLMSSLGATFLIETRFLLALMIACLALAVGMLSYRVRGDYRLFALGILASALILVGRFVLDAAPLTIGGACLLLGAYIWSFRLRQSRHVLSCRGCASPANPLVDPINPAAPNLELPIACALDQTQFAERKQLVERLAEQATERQTLPNGVLLRFEPISGRAIELATFVDLERSCCPFLTFRIDAKPGEPISLELTGPIPAQQIIRELIPETVSKLGRIIQQPPAQNTSMIYSSQRFKS